ncbi:hypothetical protein AMAG_02415 [Allomyces macrogynus ATCC 38327]|uniref:Uncharacterized protein n=1 Tax=Allomyces macrogynus (strain ATCC 38327) TaxID=578462 RepID=A0A0L0S2K1_ALLM3|nr:hypothetical protein AMAG_02415 [Allomyces macrogynus ATCC 38327]|eukprot:KNE56626.1 hypothetical protein AMAG_02415 [Allomyces macrogynus ATCC 38327]
MLSFVIMLVLAIVVFCVLVLMFAVAALAAFVHAVYFATGVISSVSLAATGESSFDSAEIVAVMGRTDLMFYLACKAADAPVVRAECDGEDEENEEKYEKNEKKAVKQDVAPVEQNKKKAEVAENERVEDEEKTDIKLDLTDAACMPVTKTVALLLFRLWCPRSRDAIIVPTIEANGAFLEDSMARFPTQAGTCDDTARMIATLFKKVLDSMTTPLFDHPTVLALVAANATNVTETKFVDALDAVLAAHLTPERRAVFDVLV